MEVNTDDGYNANHFIEDDVMARKIMNRCGCGKVINGRGRPNKSGKCYRCRRTLLAQEVKE